MKTRILWLVVTMLASTGLTLAAEPAALRVRGDLSLDDNPPATPATAKAAPAGPSPAKPAPTPLSVPLDDGDDEPVGHGFWLQGEYLLWWIRDSRTPALVTAGPPGSAGILGQNGTSVLFGGSDIDNAVRSGGRFTAGFWLNDTQTMGLESSYFFLGSRTNFFGSGSDGTAGSPTITRPFFNALSGAEDSELVALPGTLAGAVGVALSSRLQGIEVNGIGLCSVSSDCGNLYWEMLAGYRHLDLNEGLSIHESLAVAPGVAVIGGSHIDLTDRFDTRNHFDGGQVGIRAAARWERLFANVMAKLALGNTHEEARINGMTLFAPPGGTTTASAGGLLALPSNSGHFHRDVFAVVPEIGVNVGFDLTKHLRVFTGYTFLYWSRVARPGDRDRPGHQSDAVADEPRCGIAGRPGAAILLLQGHGILAQGLNLGIELTY